MSKVLEAWMTNEVKRNIGNSVEDPVSFVREYLTEAARHEMLAEELIEAAHAAQKVARILRDEVPASPTYFEARENLIEELSHVKLTSIIAMAYPNDHIVCTRFARLINALLEKGANP